MRMTESEADSAAVENAFRDIDRYVSETSQPASNSAQVLSPSQRLRVLGMQHAGSSKNSVCRTGNINLTFSERILIHASMRFMLAFCGP